MEGLQRGCFFAWFAILSTGTAAIQTSSPPFEIDSTLVPHVAYRYLVQAAGASNCFLMAWLDLRDGYQPRVYGARIELDGNTTSFTGTRLSDAFEERWPDREFDLASDGQNFLAVWHSILPTNGGIRAVLVGNDGFSSAGETVISTNLQAKAVAVTAYDGGYFVAWTEPRADERVLQGARVTRAGQVLDPNGVTLTTVKWDDSPVKVAGHADSIVVAFSHWVGPSTDGADAVAIVVTINKAISVSAPIALATGPSQQTVEAAVWWRDQFLVVWNGDYPWSADRGLFGSFITPQGTATTSWLIYRGDSYISHVSIVPRGDGGLVAWQASWSGIPDTEWRSSELDANGAFLGHSPFAAFPTSGANYYPPWWPLEIAVASNVLLAPRSAGSFMLSTAEGEVVHNDDFIKSTPNQTSAEVASNGRDYFVVWADDRWKTNWFLFARRFAQDGSPIDAEAIQVDVHPCYSNHRSDDWTSRPAIASCAGGYLILLRNGYGHIYGKRILEDGSIVDSYLELTPTATAGQPKLAVGKRCYLAVWDSYLNEGGDIQARLISPDGTVGPLLELEKSRADARSPCVASTGQDFLVIWTHRTGWYNQPLHGALISKTGRVRHLGEINMRSGDYYVLAASQQGYLFVSTAQPAYDPDEIYGSFLDRRGRVRRSETFYANRTDGISLSVAAGVNSRFVIIWNEQQGPNTSISASEITSARNVGPAYSIGTVNGYSGPGYSAVAMANANSAMIVTESYGPSQWHTISGRMVRFRR